MRTLVCLILLAAAAAAQPQQGPAGGPQAPPPQDPQGAAGPGGAAGNPWQDLLQRMMDLMQTAAGVAGQSGPGGPSQPSVGGPAQGGQPTGQSNNNPGSFQGTTPPPTYPTNPPIPTSQPTIPPTNPPTNPPTQSPRNKGPQRPQRPPPTTRKPIPVIEDCFWEGKYYRPGSDIVRGQHDRWCYVTYCDSNGQIQFWDDYNCPPNSMKPTSGHNTGSGRKPPGQQGPAHAGGGPAGPGGMGAPAGPGGPAGCNHEGMYYESGQEISSHQVGERCYGTYCSHESQVVQWEDWCISPSTVAPQGVRNQVGGAGSAGGAPAGAGPGAGRQAGSGGGSGNGGGGRGNNAGAGGGAGGAAVGGGGRGGGGGGAGGGRAGGNAPPGRGASAGPRTPTTGCYHNGLYYQPNEDVIVGNIGDMCYGYYCEGANTFVHWEDRCAPTPPPTAAAAPSQQGPFGGLFFK